VYAIVDHLDYETLSQWWWCLVGGGYVGRAAPGDDRRKIYMHRELLDLEPGDGRLADHINGTRLDNRRQNLRVVTVAANAQNRLPRSNKTSRYRNVSRHAGGKWLVRPYVGGEHHYLGLYDDEDEAGRVAREFRAAKMPYAIES